MPIVDCWALNIGVFRMYICIFFVFLCIPWVPYVNPTWESHKQCHAGFRVIADARRRLLAGALQP